MTEQNYIKYRKLKAFGNRIVFHLMRIFPIDRRLISVCTFEGRSGFGCNPKYVVQKLHEKRPDLKFVWMVNKSAGKKKFPSYIRQVNDSSLISRAYWLTRSSVWIDNYRKPYGTCKRKNQYYMNVNHYTAAIKCTGLLRGKGFSKIAYLVSKNDSDMIDDLIVDSDWCLNCFDRALVYDGHMADIGSPRCDILYGNRTKQKREFRIRHGISPGAKVVMFAPTFREGAKDGVRYVYSEQWSIDFKRLIQALERKTGDKWYICLRVHPQLAADFKSDFSDDEMSDRIIDESLADDMYEVLAGMDAYITDYSSAVFEAGYAGIPSIIYADDIRQYALDRGELMWNLATDPLDHVTVNKAAVPDLDLVFPFQIAENNDELEKIIAEFDTDTYIKGLKDFKKRVNLVWDGKASERAADMIISRIDRKVK